VWYVDDHLSAKLIQFEGLLSFYAVTSITLGNRCKKPFWTAPWLGAENLSPSPPHLQNFQEKELEGFPCAQRECLGAQNHFG
jgi:hypothetical protein